MAANSMLCHLMKSINIHVFETMPSGVFAVITGL